MKSWKIWLRGIIAAAISGAGSGLTGYYVGVPGKKLLAMVAVHIVTTVGAYLYQSPLPAQNSNGQ